MEFVYTKMQQAQPYEWRRILKGLNLIEFIVKNGSPQVCQSIKRDMHRLTQFSHFSFTEKGADQGHAIRSKV
jgi:epsin